MRERRCWNNVVFHCGALVGKTRGSRAFLTFGAFFAFASELGKLFCLLF